MNKYEKCLIKEKYSFDQSTCIKELVQEHMKDKKVKKSLAENIVVLSKSPYLMDDPNEVAHLNFNELVIGFYPDNIRDGDELKIAIEHEVAHLLANDEAMPRFHKEMEGKDLNSMIVQMKRPKHNDVWKKYMNNPK